MSNLAPVYWIPNGSLAKTIRFVQSNDAEGLQKVIASASEVPDRPDGVNLAVIGEALGWIADGKFPELTRQVGSYLASVASTTAAAESVGRVTMIADTWITEKLPEEAGLSVILYVDNPRLVRSSLEYIISSLHVPERHEGILFLTR